LWREKSLMRVKQNPGVLRKFEKINSARKVGEKKLERKKEERGQ